MMRTLIVSLWLIVAAAASGCGGESNAESTGNPGEVSFDLVAVGDSNVAGARAVLSYVDEANTRITVDGIDEQEPSRGPTNPVQLRRGSCDEPGAVVIELPRPKRAGTQAEVRLGMAELFEGRYAVVVELAEGGEQIACGDVPDESTG